MINCGTPPHPRSGRLCGNVAQRLRVRGRARTGLLLAFTASLLMSATACGSSAEGTLVSSGEPLGDFTLDLTVSRLDNSDKKVI